MKVSKVFAHIHVSSMKSALAASILFASLFLLTGCNREGDPEEIERVINDPNRELFQENVAERDSVLRAIQSVNTTGFRNAFTLLNSYSYQRFMRSDQFDEDGLLLAFREQTFEISPEGVRLTGADSAGTFDYGLFRGFESIVFDVNDPTDLARVILPEDPEFLRPRYYEAYFYRVLSDTLLWDVMAKGYEIRATPRAGDGLNIRRTRYYIDPATNQLLAMFMARIDLGLLYREESEFYMQVRLTEWGDYVPSITRFSTQVLMPFRDPRRIGTASAYFGLSKITLTR